MFEIIEIISQDDATSAVQRWSNAGGQDSYFYHVTTEKKARQIRATGLIPTRTPGSSDGTMYRDYSRQKIFFSEKGGVSYWITKISLNILNAQEESNRVRILTDRIAIVRFRKRMVRTFYRDEIGKLDSKRWSYYTEEPIHANRSRTLSV